MKKVSVLGIDLSKNVFELCGMNDVGKVVWSKQVMRRRLRETVANLPKCVIGMEACGGANYWARKFMEDGHEAKLMAPQFVKPYVKSNKTDRADAEAIAEAVTRPTMRFVGIKRVEQQDIQSLHRIRRMAIRNQVALSNEIRGLLLEYGIAVSQGIGKLRHALPEIIEDSKNELTDVSRAYFRDLQEELWHLDEKVTQYDREIARLSRSKDVCQRLEKIPGVGPVTSTAIYAAVGNPKVFKNGREFAAWLGLVPKQHSSGGKEHLQGISKRGDKYIRTLLIHGARSWALVSRKHTDSRSRWVQSLIQRRGKYKAYVALANKNARTLWKLLATGEVYRDHSLIRVGSAPTGSL